jgi:nitroreductase
MELQDAIQNRRSIRHFLPQSVPEETIREIAGRALWAPSWGNTQPWDIVIASGEALARFQKENKEALLSGKQSVPEIPMPQSWPQSNIARYKNLGKSVIGSLAIPREDKEARLQHFAQMYALFDAPAVILLAVDKKIAMEYSMLDIGLYLQTFCLLAHDRGLGTCILAATVMYPELTHEIFSIPETKRLVIGAALGWPDPDAAVNQFERERGSEDELVKWVS